LDVPTSVIGPRSFDTKTQSLKTGMNGIECFSERFGPQVRALKIAKAFIAFSTAPTEIES
jgi:hypothetical protein